MTLTAASPVAPGVLLAVTGVSRVVVEVEAEGVIVEREELAITPWGATVEDVRETTGIWAAYTGVGLR